MPILCVDADFTIILNPEGSLELHACVHTDRGQQEYGNFADRDWTGTDGLTPLHVVSCRQHYNALGPHTK